MAGVERSELRRVLRDLLDEAPEKRTDFAEAMACDDGLLGKKLNGTNGRDVGLGELEALEPQLVVRWFKRAGRLYGLEVHEIPQARMVEQMFEAVDELFKAYRLAQIGRPSPLKVELPAREPAQHRKVG